VNAVAPPSSPWFTTPEPSVWPGVCARLGSSMSTQLAFHDCPTRSPLERAMHGPCVANEIRSRPGMAREELVRQHVALQAIARSARGDEVAWRVRATSRDRVHVVERGHLQRQRNGAVDAASAAVPHGGSLDRPPVVSAEVETGVPGEAARCAGERDSVETTSRHCTSL
jgi:hypothetical protein